jgi:holin-like protein
MPIRYFQFTVLSELYYNEIQKNQEEMSMKYIWQMTVILSVTCVAELLKYFIPLPIPASIYGLVLMFLLLVTGIVKLPQVKETAEFLIEIMTIMFIPATVGLMENWDVLRPILVPLIVIIPVTTVLVMGVTGRTAQRILRRGEKEK